MNCLTDSELERIARDEVEFASFEEHLESCSNCRKRLEDEKLFADVQIAIAQAGSANESLQEDALQIEGGPIAGYRILSEIHRGGQGVVYKAIQENTNRVVALKILLQGAFASQRQRQRFEREIDVAASLKHPNIVTVYDSGVSHSRLYFAMEYVEGAPLESQVQRVSIEGVNRSSKERREERRRVLEMFRRICEAVAHAHQRGIIHRDLKPSNIRLEEDGEPRILDFGLAKIAFTANAEDQEFQTREGEFLGTLAYASPEQTTGDPDAVDIRSDVYSLGMMLYELLTGQRPYPVEGDLSQTLANIRESEPKSLSRLDASIDNELETIVSTALAKEPQRRYQSAHELCVDLGHYLSGEPINAKRDSSWYLLSKAVRRHRGLVTTAALFLAVISTSLVVSLAFWRQAVIDRNDAIEAGGVAKIAMNSAQEQRELAIKKGEAAVASRDEAEFQAYAANVAAADGALRNLDVAEAKLRLNNAPEKHRNWEWHHLGKQLDSSIATFQGNSSYVEQIQFLTQSNILVSTGWDRTVRFWDPDEGEELHRFELEDPVWSLAVSKGEKFIAAGDWNHTVRVWNVATKELVSSFKAPTRRLPALAFHPRLDLLLVGCWPFGEDEEQILPQIICLEYKTGTVLKRLTLQEVPHHIRFADDGTKFFTTEATRTGVWDAGGFERKRELPGRLLAIDSESNKCVLTDGRKLWIAQGKDGRRLTELAGHRGEIFCAAFSDTGNWIATGGRDKTVRIWDGESGELVRTCLGHQWTVTSLCFEPAAKVFFSASWDQTIKRWEVDSDSSADRIEAHELAITDLQVSGDGRLLASSSLDQSVKIWDLQQRKCLAELHGHRKTVQSVAFSHDDQFLASASWDGTVRIWDLASLAQPTPMPCTSLPSRSLPGHEDLALGLCFHPNTEQLLSCSRDNTIRVWDVKTGKLLRVIQGHDDHVHSIAFNSGGTLLASSGHRSIRLWDAETYAPLQTFDRNILREDYSLAFTPQDQLVVAGMDAKTLRFWDPSSFEVVDSVYAHTDEIYSVRFSPDQSRMVSVASDATVKVWDLEHRLPLLTLTLPGGKVQRVVFSQQGEFLVAGTEAGELVFWDGGESQW